MLPEVDAGTDEWSQWAQWVVPDHHCEIQALAGLSARLGSETMHVLKSLQLEAHLSKVSAMK